MRVHIQKRSEGWPLTPAAQHQGKRRQEFKQFFACSRQKAIRLNTCRVTYHVDQSCRLIMYSVMLTDCTCQILVASYILRVTSGQPGGNAPCLRCSVQGFKPVMTSYRPSHEVACSGCSGPCSSIFTHHAWSSSSQSGVNSLNLNLCLRSRPMNQRLHTAAHVPRKIAFPPIKQGL